VEGIIWRNPDPKKKEKKNKKKKKRLPKRRLKSEEGGEVAGLEKKCQNGKKPGH